MKIYIISTKYHIIIFWKTFWAFFSNRFETKPHLSDRSNNFFKRNGCRSYPRNNLLCSRTGEQQYRKQTFQQFSLTYTILANHRINTLIGLKIYLHRADTGYMLKTNRTVKQPFIHIICPSIFQTA